MIPFLMIRVFLVFSLLVQHKIDHKIFKEEQEKFRSRDENGYLPVRMNTQFSMLNLLIYLMICVVLVSELPKDNGAHSPLSEQNDNSAIWIYEYCRNDRASCMSELSQATLNSGVCRIRCPSHSTKQTCRVTNKCPKNQDS